ncbi:MAG: helix-turn-helix domain-containing protein [Afipia sp.]|nr:helix-turn-helix domain-containing protein [Afipia sp.]
MSAFLGAQISVLGMKQPGTKEWIRAVARHMNLSLSDLALKSGLAASTVTRYVNDASGRIGITKRTLDAISDFTGIPQHVIPGERRLTGFGEPDAIPFDNDNEPQPDWVKQAVARFREESASLVPWIMKGWALDQVGVLPGDILLIDLNLRPKNGDIVCAQITDWATGSAETVFRRFDPPFLTAHSGKLGPQKPELIDDDRVKVRGVMVARIGLRR